MTFAFLCLATCDDGVVNSESDGESLAEVYDVLFWSTDLTSEAAASRSSRSSRSNSASSSLSLSSSESVEAFRLRFRPRRLHCAASGTAASGCSLVKCFLRLLG